MRILYVIFVNFTANKQGGYNGVKHHDKSLLLPFIFGGEFRCVFFKGLSKKGHIVEAALYGGLADRHSVPYQVFYPFAAIAVYKLYNRLPRYLLEFSGEAVLIGQGICGDPLQREPFGIVLPDKPYGGFYLPKGKAAFIMRMGRRAAGGGMMLDQLDQQVQQRRLQFCFLAGNPLGVIQADNFPEESRGPLAVYNGGKVKGRTVYIGPFAELHIEDHGIIRQFGFCAGVMDLVGVDDGQTVFYQIVSLAADEHISPTGSA